jgi:hypothetical protein
MSDSQQTEVSEVSQPVSTDEDIQKIFRTTDSISIPAHHFRPVPMETVDPSLLMEIYPDKPLVRAILGDKPVAGPSGAQATLAREPPAT